MAVAAQSVYDGWDDEDSDGGICDEISREIQTIIASELNDVDVTDGGHDGDDHATTLASDSSGQIFEIDIPANVYERGGGYSWSKIPNITIEASDVLISKVDLRRDQVFD